MHSAIKVAKHFVDYANENDVRDMTILKLMKTTYIAHGWMLGIYGKALISEDIEAWKYGPVIPELYRETKHFGRNPVTYLPDEFNVKLDEEEQSIVDRVSKSYKDFTAGQLIALTHRKGTPWHKIKKAYGCGAGVIIPNEDIRTYYAGLYNA